MSADPVTYDEARLYSVRKFKAAGDGVADDGAAIAEGIGQAESEGATVWIPPGTYRVADTVAIPAGVNLLMEGLILYDGPHDRPALRIGTAGSNHSNRWAHGLAVRNARPSDWSDEHCIGVELLNLVTSDASIRRVEGFTIGIHAVGTGPGNAFPFAYNTLHLGQLKNNRIGLDLDALEHSYANQNLWIGGLFEVDPDLHTTRGRIGVRTRSADGSYRLQEQNFFLHPVFHLGTDDLAAGESCCFEFLGSRYNEVYGASERSGAKLTRLVHITGDDADQSEGHYCRFYFLYSAAMQEHGMSYMDALAQEGVARRNGLLLLRDQAQHMAVLGGHST